MNKDLSTHVTNSASTDAFLDETDGVMGLLLPTVNVSNGVFAPAKGNDQADIDNLPDGSKAKLGIYIAKRVGVLSWKNGYDAKGEDEMPAFVAFADDNNDDDVRLVGAATKARQMNGRDTSSKWDFENSKVGHLKPLLEILVWLPESGFTVIATSPNYHNVVDGVMACRKIEKEAKEDTVIIASFKPEKKPHKSAGWSWESDFCGMTAVHDDETTKSLGKLFLEYKELTKENSALRDAVATWLSSSDRPITDEIREALHAGVKLNPPKF